MMLPIAPGPKVDIVSSFCTRLCQDQLNKRIRCPINCIRVRCPPLPLACLWRPALPRARRPLPVLHWRACALFGSMDTAPALPLIRARLPPCAVDSGRQPVLVGAL